MAFCKCRWHFGAIEGADASGGKEPEQQHGQQQEESACTAGAEEPTLAALVDYDAVVLKDAPAAVPVSPSLQLHAAADNGSPEEK